MDISTKEKPAEICQQQQEKEENWKAFAQETTLHGLRIVGSDNVSLVRRSLWGALLLTGFGYLLFTTSSLVSRVRNPVYVTDISIEDGHLHGKQFPAVTICNFNQYRKNYLVAHPEVIPVIAKMFDFRVTDFEKELGIDAPDDIPEEVNVTASLIAAAHRLEDMVIHSTYKGMVLEASKYFTTVFTNIGVCQTFNGDSKDNLLIENEGRTGAFTAILDVEEEEYLYGENLLLGVGFWVCVHDQNEVPIMNSQGFGISPQKTTFVSLSATKAKLDPGSAEGCVNTSAPGFVNPLKYYSTYSIQSCLLECITDEVASECGCKMYFDPGNASLCLNQESTSCYNDKKAKLNKNNKELLATCNCRVQCEFTQYGIEISESAYPGKLMTKYKEKLFYYRPTAAKNYSDEYFERNALRLEVFFKDLSATTTKQIPEYGFMDCGGDLGGYMGLMFGASLLTVIEILEFLFLTFFNKIKNKKSSMETQSN